MKWKLSLLLAVLIIVSGSVVTADTTITRITTNGYSDSFPCIKGDYLVWQANVDGDQEIFLYNKATGVTTRMTDNDYDDVLPQTDGTYVVWQGLRDGEWDVFVWDGGQTQVVSEAGAQDYSPKVANGFVVWTSEPMYMDSSIGPGEIVLYDIESQILTVLSASVDPDNTRDDTSPRINSQVVIWTQTDEQNNGTVYMYDLSAHTITENPNYPWRDSPQTDGNLSVLIQNDGQDREVFLYNGEFTKYHQITSNVLEDRSPSISGNFVAWMADGEIFLAECQYLSLVGPRNNASLSTTEPATFVWEGIGYDRFKIAFSSDKDFQEEHTLTVSLAASQLSGTSFTPTESQWWLITMMERTRGRVYWRIEGEATNGSVALTETWAFSLADDRLKSMGVEAIHIDKHDAGVTGSADIDAGSSSCFITAAGR